ncbi:hypothetical protein Tco_1091697 [Tanacetum coccineum]|uniref:Uncharacterized protein n=1 Tax=Tanacetum coccineum TaxID=301880 RepID=A0ABQ5I8Z1_9ASTR
MLQIYLQKHLMNRKSAKDEIRLQALVDGKKIIVSEASIRSDLQLDDADGMDCLSNATIFEELTRMGYEKISQSDNVAKEVVNEENIPTHSNDPLLSGEDRLKLKELMTLCTNLQNRVLDLEHTKTTQALKNQSLKRRVNKLEKKQRLRTIKLRIFYMFGLSARVISSDDEGLGEEDASKQGRKIHDIDVDEDITLENVHDEDMFGVNDLEGDEVVVESEVAAKMKDDEVNVAEEVVSTTGDAAPVSATTITIVELTLAQTLAELKSARPKAKGLVVHDQEPSESITTTTGGILL